MIRILAVFTTLLTRLQIFQQIGSTVCLNDGRSECIDQITISLSLIHI